MSHDQERLYVASRIVGGVADCLVDYAHSNERIHLSDFLELVGRLDLAVEAIRYANGAQL
jgi:hypothetical protein